MPDLSFLPDLLAWLPFESMQPRFMRQALLGILLLCPMAAMLGVQVLNFRMAFFRTLSVIRPLPASLLA